ncbi:MAG: KH domain-containing protein [Bulleidia sp.]|nr:KH domain-containing protein [Erysipelotrichaceae bacterium]MDD6664154.1 KH domain-containing protein [Bulleidia sp.]MDY4808480.1 R3H domain-containing nucleic acid-binding protein [Bulleidia sp.]HAW12992.1 protein jag [Erysipelotrichaceae bacterium]
MKNYQAKTLEEIIEQAAEDYGCDTSSLMYNVLEEKDGILGIGKSITAEVFTMDDVKEFLFDYMGDFFTGIDLDLECAIEEKDNAFIVNLNADNNAVLIGKMGKTLSAFNTVIKAAVNAKFKKRIDILIDVNHYKSDRYYKLRGMAKRIGKQVQRDHVKVALDPMPNDERKVIHKALNEWHNIKTESEGEGSNRHVCISYVEDSAE